MPPADKETDNITYLNVHAKPRDKLVYGTKEILCQEKDPGIESIPVNKVLVNVLNTTSFIDNNLSCLGQLMVLCWSIINT